MLLQKSTVNRRHTAPLLLRLLPEQRERLQKITDKLGKSMADYIRDAVMAYVATHEEDFRVEKERVHLQHERRGRPRGLGIDNNFRKNATRMTPNDQPAVQQAPVQAPATVVIQQAPAPTSPGTDIKILATYVAAAGEDSIDRESRERMAENAIRAAAKSPEELERLAKALDDELVLLDTKRGDRPGNLSKPASPWGWISKI